MSRVLRSCLGILGALPFLVALLGALDVAPAVVLAFDRLFEWHCHRDPSRTLTASGFRLPVCARCTGLYAGLLLAAMLPSLRVDAGRLLIATGVAALALLLDVGTEALGLRVPSLTTRLFTGLCFAYAATAAVLAHGEQPAPGDARARQLEGEATKPRM